MAPGRVGFPGGDQGVPWCRRTRRGNGDSGLSRDRAGPTAQNEHLGALGTPARSRCRTNPPNPSAVPSRAAPLGPGRHKWLNPVRAATAPPGPSPRPAPVTARPQPSPSSSPDLATAQPGYTGPGQREHRERHSYPGHRERQEHRSPGSTGGTGDTKSTGSTGSTGVPGASGAPGAHQEHREPREHRSPGDTKSTGVPGAPGAPGTAGAPGAPWVPAVPGVPRHDLRQEGASRRRAAPCSV